MRLAKLGISLPSEKDENAVHCCSDMAGDLAQTCDQHPDRYDCPDMLISHFRGGYGIIVHNGGTSAVEIAFCPWCGATLPPIADIVEDDEDDPAEDHAPE